MIEITLTVGIILASTKHGSCFGDFFRALHRPHWWSTHWQQCSDAACPGVLLLHCCCLYLSCLSS